MILIPHIKMATSSLRANKVRTFLTLLGIIIGVMSVTTIIGLGEGVKNQVNQQISDLGGDLITVTPGRSNQSSAINNLLGAGASPSTSQLTQKDQDSLEKISNVQVASGVMRLDGSVKRGLEKIVSSNILAVDEDYLRVTSQKIKQGQFFSDIQNNRSAILASNVATELFGEDDPIGSTIQVRGADFVVVGVLDTYEGFNFGQPINDHVLVPQVAGRELNNGTLQFQQVNLKLKNTDKSAQTANSVKKILLSNHDGEEDFTITTQDQLSGTTDDVFRALTTFTAAVASISLVVGGIGVMNIMLVTVTERTKEIGIRKAIGATRTQIMMQFLTEALIITLAGGIIGIIFSIIISYIIQAQTAIQPSLNLWVITLATAVSLAVGVIFGTWPAVRAARKDPVESLRHD